MSDVIVIGGGISGLVAATHLAKAGKQVTLLEAQSHLGGLCALTPFGEGFAASSGAQTIFALDPRITADLKLARHGLKFAVRDMPLIGLHGDGKHIVVQRDTYVTAANIAVHSVEDAKNWPRFRRELFDLARVLRPLWQEPARTYDATPRIARLSKMGAMAWLDSWFESDALKAALCFDATGGGLSPLEPGSALTLVWRAAQEMSGLQGAVAMVAGGTLVESLTAAARAAGVNIQTDARVVMLLGDGAAITGVRLAHGKEHSASQVLSSLPRKQVLTTMTPQFTSGIAQTARYAAEMPVTSQACVRLALRDDLRFSGSAIPDDGRFIVCENPSVLASADFAARAGQLADELPMEIVSLPPSNGVPNGQHIVSILVRPVPRNPPKGWQTLKPRLVEQVVQVLERFAPGTAATIVAAKAFTPDKSNDLHYQTSTNMEQLLAGYDTRIKSSLPGLLFCGVDAEPVPAVSGRAARLAAAMSTGRR
jgi:phytoene dehydrogenase-like protein